ncbi:hypothetical protein RB653_000844 [Dictyostelium firmibasis]|uniref:Uncharacterized protein n=1 Tax=Dictyostelium firmibasis TaxID=79012 RepID=A0AAN7Z1H7_9MYCE
MIRNRIKNQLSKYSLLSDYSEILEEEEKEEEEEKKKRNELLEQEIEENKKTKPCPENDASLFSKFTFGWVTKLILKAYIKNSLNINDIFDVPNYLKSSFTSKFLKNNQTFKSNTKYSLILNIYMKFIISKNKKLILTQLLKVLFTFLSPLILKLFIEFIKKPNSEKSIIEGLVYCGLLFLTSFLSSMIDEYYVWFGMIASSQVRGCLTSMIFEKSLRLSNSARIKYNTGKITNLMSIDVENFCNFFWTNSVEIFFQPFQLIFLLILLISEVGWSGLVGTAAILISFPINSYLAKKTSDHYEKSLKYTDKRVATTTEFIKGIRFSKLYTWEPFFLKKIDKQRTQELKSLFDWAFYWMCETIVITTNSTFIFVATFATFSLSGNTIKLETAFTAMSILESIRILLILLPCSYYSLMELIPSNKRIESFLSTSEINEKLINTTKHNQIDHVTINNGTFKWNEENFEESDDDDDDDDDDDQDNKKEEKEKENKEEEEEEEGRKDIDKGEEDKNEQEENNIKNQFVLENINFKAPIGKLTIICSPVGGGKTSLINALIGEIHKINGEVNVPDNISYTDQNAFLLSTSLRQNILFGKELDIDYYKQVIEACCLTTDLAQLAALDLTEIGEGGINLSGGQKQRVSLARALYSNSDCIIMDEPLSAVDPEVANYLFEKCINGMMKNKTRILVTHQIQFIPFADHIVIIKDGSIIQGSYKELKEEKSIDFESLVFIKSNTTTNSNNEENEENVSNKKIKKEQTIDEKEIMESIKVNYCKELRERAKLLVEEDKNEGEVSLDTYKQYLKYGSSNLNLLITFSIFLIGLVVNKLSDFWLTIWTEQSLKDKSQVFYIGGYVLIFIISLLLIFLRYYMVTKISFASAKKLHNLLITSVSNSSIQFFDSNPSGRIVNRFSNDISNIDTSMSGMFLDTFSYVFAIVIGIISIVYINPMTIVPFAILSIFYYQIQTLYRASVRELNRCISVSQSPIISFLSECCSGLSTIRSFKQQSRFIGIMNDYIDDSLKCEFANFAVEMWISTRLEFLSSIIVLVVSLFTLFNSYSSPALSVLAVSTARSMTSYLKGGSRQLVDLEKKMNSFERINSYINLPVEAVKSYDSDTVELVNWPWKGEVKFNNVQVNYHLNSEPSLKDFTLSVKAKEKIGIVGRTGAGKTTIGSSLFRMVECSSGSISIDGVDIKTVGLNKLRGSIGIVPQDPWLFSGTIRSNIDPFNQYDDEKIWNYLELVKLKKLILDMPLKLKTKIQENGNTLSFGQKQLLCLCRCLLKNPKLIVMDEATSGIDYQTAETIKSVICENLINSTMLTIAHRLDTIIDSNKIAVIDKGKLVEFDTPTNLMNSNSKFRKIVKFQTKLNNIS